jgi:hypothetical protein
VKPLIASASSCASSETLGCDERLILVQHLQRARVDADDAELDDVVPRRIEPGGLEVDEGDGRLRRPGTCEARSVVRR